MRAPIETLDLHDFIRIPTSSDFIEKIRKCFHETGFFFLINHEISLRLIHKAFSQDFPDFFVNTPLEIRKKYEYPGIQRQMGYTSLRIEKGEHAEVEDEKHFFHVLDGGIPYMPEPTCKGFMETCYDLFPHFARVYGILMEAVALALEQEPDYFQGKLGNSIMRPIHYPEQANPETSDKRVEKKTEGGNVVGMCASRHTDINMLTLLFARSKGLELWYGDRWLPIEMKDPDVLIVNCGDMLQHLSNGYFRSGDHRVVCEPGIERYSVPFFGHVLPDVSIKPLNMFGKPDTLRFPYETAGPFLRDRLEEIGLNT